MRPWNLLCKWTITALAVSVTSLCLASIEVNNADEAELDSVKGLGPASTARWKWGYSTMGASGRSAAG